MSGDPTFSGFAAATMIVVATAVIGSLTVLPALRLRNELSEKRAPVNPLVYDV